MTAADKLIADAVNGIPPCGTYPAYTRHLRRGEPTDEACRQANVRRQAARQSTNFTHGYSGYQNYKCRCETCRAANAAAVTRMRAQRAAQLAEDPAAVSHGVASTYDNWRCRCADCRAASARRARQRRAEMRIGGQP